MLYKNKFEQTVYDSVIKNIVDKKYTFQINDSFDYYLLNRKLLCNPDELWLFKNTPKRYGTNTNSEMVLVGKGLDMRIDCKYQLNDGHIQVDNILGEIHRNVIDNKLYEKEMVFIVDGSGISLKDIASIQKFLNRYKIKEVNIYTLSGFIRQMK